MTGRAAHGALPPSGARHVLAYNWPMYTAGSAAVLAGAVIGRRYRAAWAGSALAAWWLSSSLIASHRVYDRSTLHSWRWLDVVLPEGPGRHLVVSAGLDEASEVLRARHPRAPQTIADLYDGLPVTESSLRRARRRVPPQPGSLTAWAQRLPGADASYDTVIAPFAVHELRRAVDREALLDECARLLRPGGAVVLVEHCRDAANAAVYGPGAWHFMPRGEWLRLAARSGLTVAHESRIARYVTVLVLRRRART
ncbi:class I SAM-dependent methyltransferase [Streptantibioticus ferralitis]|uniref:Class I SAM-dependent methyltransferase n=1 Tax=Streptantibioticus ferralitis TaxID=236510 RepID=A0ABT5Z5N0_9ACTN|nr:class I SAM-dependent methyltransferase [Streptantibioticus ferralitis]MDF2259029.1 class I SAM-dependent methyltransferase [Streptantibioticus ferralitis]